MTVAPTQRAVLIVEDKDANLAGQIRTVLANAAIEAEAEGPGDRSVEARRALERRLTEAALAIAVWTKYSIASAWTLDQADVAARSGTLLNFEAGAKTPLGLDSFASIKLKVRTGKIVGGRFDAIERITAAAERMGLRSPRRLRGFRWLSCLVDLGSQWAIALGYAASDADHGAVKLFAATIFLVAGYPIGRLFDLGARLIGVSLRNYMGRLIARALGQIAGQIGLMVLLLSASSPTLVHLSIDIAMCVLLRTAPYLLFFGLRCRLLA